MSRADLKSKRSSTGPRRISRSAAAASQPPPEAPSAILTIRAGVSYREYQKSGLWNVLSKQDWAYSLNVSLKTFERYQKLHKTFEGPQAERLIEIKSLFAKGEEVFGTLEGFMKWMNHACAALGGAIPKQMLDTHTGITLVDDVLVRIDYGVYA